MPFAAVSGRTGPWLAARDAVRTAVLADAAWTLTGLGADSNLAGGNNPRWERRVLAVVAMFIGAAVGAWLVLRYGLTLPLAIASAGALAPIVSARHPTAVLPMTLR